MLEKKPRDEFADYLFNWLAEGDTIKVVSPVEDQLVLEIRSVCGSLMMLYNLETEILESF